MMNFVTYDARGDVSTLSFNRNHPGLGARGFAFYEAGELHKHLLLKHRFKLFAKPF
jgi:hypothetical protein